MSGLQRRAARLARLYPSSWRRQFPDFEEFLAEDLAEDRPGVRRDVVRGAAMEHLRVAGIVPTGAADRSRSGLALVYAALIPFAGLAAGMWSQLHTAVAVGGGGAPPVFRSSDLVVALMTGVVLAALAAAVVLFVAQGLRRRRQVGAAGRPDDLGSPWLPAVSLAGSMGLLTLAGWLADRSGWYSPAAAALPRTGIAHLGSLWLRGVIAAITPAWAHPALFGRMPSGQLVAALAAPVAVVVGAVALLHLVRRVTPPGPQRAQVGLAVVTAAAMVLTVTAGVHWLVVRPPGAHLTRWTGSSADLLAPGHTAWSVVGVLGMLAVIALIGARRALRGVHLA